MKILIHSAKCGHVKGDNMQLTQFKELIKEVNKINTIEDIFNDDYLHLLKDKQENSLIYDLKRYKNKVKKLIKIM